MRDFDDGGRRKSTNRKRTKATTNVKQINANILDVYLTDVGHIEQILSTRLTDKEIQLSRLNHVPGAKDEEVQGRLYHCEIQGKRLSRSTRASRAQKTLLTSQRISSIAGGPCKGDTKSMGRTRPFAKAPSEVQ